MSILNKPLLDVMARRWDVRVAASVLVLMIVLAGAAPFYAQWVGVDPFTPNVAGRVLRGGRIVDIMQPNDNPLHLGLTPLGPSWAFGPFILGADAQGRDVAARFLYGARNSLIIAASAALLCLTMATFFGLIAGYFGGWRDQVISRIMDVLWAIPVYLFAVTLSVVTVGHDLNFSLFHISGDSIVIPIGIIALIYVPYTARPVRARTKALSQSGFVLAARGFGASSTRIILREILPLLVETLLVMAPLITALSLLAESALSFLSLGVQAPAASWGSLIHDGEGLMYTRPTVAIAPGLGIAFTVLALNVIGDALQTELRKQSER